MDQNDVPVKNMDRQLMMRESNQRFQSYGNTFAADLYRERLRVARNLFKTNLVGHYGCVNAVEFSHGGRFLASGGDDKRVLVWDIEKSLAGLSAPRVLACEHASNIFCLQFDSRNQKLISGGNDDLVICHDFETGRLDNVFKQDNPVYGLSIDPMDDNLFATASENGKILLFDHRSDPSNPLIVAEQRSSFHAVEFHPIVNNLLVTANSHQGAALYDVRKPNQTLVQYGHLKDTPTCMSVRFNRKGNLILALRRRQPPILYRMHSPEPVCTFYHRNYYNSCTMKSCTFAGEDDELVISGSDDFNLYVWRVSEVDVDATDQWVESTQMVLYGHRSIVNQVRYNREKCLLASSGVEKIIKIWSPFTQRNWTGSLLEEATCSDNPRELFSPLFMNVMTVSSLSHDYSSHNTNEDPRMLAFFDSLIRQEIEGLEEESNSSSGSQAETEEQSTDNASSFSFLGNSSMNNDSTSTSETRSTSDVYADNSNSQTTSSSFSDLINSDDECELTDRGTTATSDRSNDDEDDGDSNDNDNNNGGRQILRTNRTLQNQRNRRDVRPNVLHRRRRMDNRRQRSRPALSTRAPEAVANRQQHQQLHNNSANRIAYLISRRRRTLRNLAIHGASLKPYKLLRVVNASGNRSATSLSLGGRNSLRPVSSTLSSRNGRSLVPKNIANRATSQQSEDPQGSLDDEPSTSNRAVAAAAAAAAVAAAAAAAVTKQNCDNSKCHRRIRRKKYKHRSANKRTDDTLSSDEPATNSASISYLSKYRRYAINRTTAGEPSTSTGITSSYREVPRPLVLDSDDDEDERGAAGTDAITASASETTHSETLLPRRLKANGAKPQTATAVIDGPTRLSSYEQQCSRKDGANIAPKSRLTDASPSTRTRTSPPRRKSSRIRNLIAAGGGRSNSSVADFLHDYADDTSDENYNSNQSRKTKKMSKRKEKEVVKTDEDDEEALTPEESILKKLMARKKVIQQRVRSVHLGRYTTNNGRRPLNSKGTRWSTHNFGPGSTLSSSVNFITVSASRTSTRTESDSDLPGCSTNIRKRQQATTIHKSNGEARAKNATVTSTTTTASSNGSLAMVPSKRIRLSLDTSGGGSDNAEKYTGIETVVKNGNQQQQQRIVLCGQMTPPTVSSADHSTASHTSRPHNFSVVPCSSSLLYTPDSGVSMNNCNTPTNASHNNHSINSVTNRNYNNNSELSETTSGGNYSNNDSLAAITLPTFLKRDHSPVSCNGDCSSYDYDRGAGGDGNQNEGIIGTTAFCTQTTNSVDTVVTAKMSDSSNFHQKTLSLHRNYRKQRSYNDESDSD